MSNQHKSVVEKNKKETSSSYDKTMEARSTEFEESLASKVIAVQKFTINPQTAGFLQSQGIDTTQFQSIEGLPIQHQLTHELVDVLDFVADYAQHYQHKIYQTHLTKYCAHLASLSQ